MTLNRIGVDDSLIQPNGMMVLAFDGTKTSTCGELDLKILIASYEFEVSLVVMDIPAAFNLLIRRPWIHSVRAITSSMH